jgi:hypothetical protein
MAKYIFSHWNDLPDTPFCIIAQVIDAVCDIAGKLQLSECSEFCNFPSNTSTAYFAEHNTKRGVKKPPFSIIKV